jgi:hypothetical protein
MKLFVRRRHWQPGAIALILSQDFKCLHRELRLLYISVVAQIRLDGSCGGIDVLSAASFPAPRSEFPLQIEWYPFPTPDLSAWR